MSDVRRVRVSSSTLSREVQGQTVLLQLDSGEYFGLDEVGTRIWQLIAADGDLDAARRTLLDEYDVDAAILAADFTRIVDELIARRLIDVDPAASGSRG
jgi:hypothetical protein